MNKFCNKLTTAVTAIVLWFGAGLALADQETLDEMLGALARSDRQEGLRLAGEIERLWSLSGSTTVDMLFRRGHEALEADDATAAIEHFTAVTDHAPNFAEGWHARAMAYYMKDLYGPALSDLQQALSLNPQNYNALFGLGLMFVEFEENARAEDAFRQVLTLHPHHDNAQDALAGLNRRGIGRAL